MNMSPKNIPYKSIIMRCDNVNENAFTEVVDCFSIISYNSEMNFVWVELQKEAKHFNGYSNAEIGCYTLI